MKRMFILFVLVILSLNFLALSIPQANANPDFVTEDANWITIENDYFIAKIDKASANWHGHIREFYIKPEDTVNIVPTNTYKFLGGHEMSADSLNGASSDWGGANGKTSETVSIVYQSAFEVVIETVSRWGEVIGGTTYPDMINVEYTTFYADKPYYVVSTTRTYPTAYSHLKNYQICFFYNYYWFDRAYVTDHNGTIAYKTNTGWTPYIFLWEARNLGFYPWLMFYNTTYGLGHFVMPISANPPTIGLGEVTNAGVGTYWEMQIEYSKDRVSAGESHYLTYVAGVAGNTTYVDTLSKSFYSTTVYADEDFTNTITTSNTLTMPYSQIYAQWLSNQIDTVTGSFIYLGNNGGNFPAALDSITTPRLKFVRLYLEYVNNTSTYQLWGSSGQTSYIHVNNGTYLKRSFQRDYQSKIRVNATFEFWSDSDAYDVTFNFTTLTSANVLSFRVNRNYEWGVSSPPADPNDDGVTLTSLSDNIVKMNATQYFGQTHGVAPEQGYFFQNFSDTKTALTATGQTSAKWHALKYDTQTAVGLGQSFSFKLRIQKFMRFSFENHAVFGLSDVLGLHESLNDRFAKTVWVKFPLTNASSDFRINHLGGRNSIIYHVQQSADRLAFTVSAPTGQISTIKIYCGGKGEPIVNGASHDYDSLTDVLTLYAVPNVPIVLNWAWEFTGYQGAAALIGLVPFVWISSILATCAIAMFSISRQKADVDEKMKESFGVVIILSVLLGLTPTIVSLVQSLVT